MAIRRAPTSTILLALVALAAALWAVLGSQWVLPELTANSDEGLYLLQADTLAAGMLEPPVHPTEPESFRPWFSTIEDGRYVLKYTPVHAAVLAAGSALTTSTRIALGAIALAGVLMVAALARELGLRASGAVIAAALFALSPLTLQLNITYLPYGTSLALGLGATTLALRAARIASPRLAVAAGFVWGVAFFARPYDAVLFALAAVVGIAFTERREHWRSTIVGAGVGAIVPVGVFLAFNQAVTGSPFQLPFNLLEPADRLGWGPRRALPTDPITDFGPDESLRSLGRNLLLVVGWTGGGLIAVALAGRSFWRAGRSAAPAAALVVVWSIGYALFWGAWLTAFVWNGALFLGPYYYFPLVAVVSIGAADGLDRLRTHRPALAALATTAMLALSAATFVPSVRDQLDRSEARSEVADALSSEITTPAVVFLPPVYGPYLQNPFSFLRNDADIDSGAIVYALSRGERADAAVIAAFPGRSVYRMDLPGGWSDEPGFEPVVQISRLDTE